MGAKRRMQNAIEPRAVGRCSLHSLVPPYGLVHLNRTGDGGLVPTQRRSDHSVFERLAREPQQQVLDRNLRHLAARLLRRTPQVRCNDHILALE